MPNINTGKLSQYMPVMAPAHDTDESFLINVKDLNKMIHQHQPQTVYMYDHGSTLSYHHGHFNNTGDTRRLLRKIYNNGYALTKSRHHKTNQRKAQKI